MRKIVFVLFILSVFVSSSFATDIYTYKDKDGNTVISNNPIPEKYQNKAKKVEAYDKDSPEAIERYEGKQERRRIYREERDYNRQEQQAQKQSPPARSVDASCKRECSVDLNICKSDCSRSSVPYKSGKNTDSYERTRCNDSCMKSYDKCVDRCWN
jgi:hypothetical protein